jgi:hypothetical protein
LRGLIRIFALGAKPASGCALTVPLSLTNAISYPLSIKRFAKDAAVVPDFAPARRLKSGTLNQNNSSLNSMVLWMPWTQSGCDGNGDWVLEIGY